MRCGTCRRPTWPDHALCYWHAKGAVRDWKTGKPLTRDAALFVGIGVPSLNGDGGWRPVDFLAEEWTREEEERIELMYHLLLETAQGVQDRHEREGWRWAE